MRSPNIGGQFALRLYVSLVIITLQLIAEGDII
jgi:hypothetical protein